MSTNKKIFLVLVFFLHLSVVIFFVFGSYFPAFDSLRTPSENRIVRGFQRIFRTYAVSTGSNVRFDFFAPTIQSTTQLVTKITDESGREFIKPLIPHNSRESLIRLQNIIISINDVDYKNKERSLYTSSWAAKVFALHPHAKKVEFDLQEFYLPNWKNFVKGEKTFWRSFYTVQFSRMDNQIKEVK